MHRTPILSGLAGLASFTLAVAELECCGGPLYDPTQYVCHPGNFLCPIIAGEALSRCGSACYSTFQYTCSHNALSQLPEAEGAVTLTVSNPDVPDIDGQPVNACSFHLQIGGTTCSYCPDVVPEESCPPGNVTAIYPSYGMNVMVPGGQQYYLDPNWSIGYTQAHSAHVPPGSVRGGTVAYKNGGFANVNEGALGWKACGPPEGRDNDRIWTLHGVNETNAAQYDDCFWVNLKVEEQPEGSFAAWQYT